MAATLFSKNRQMGCRETRAGSDLPMKAQLLSSGCQVLAAEEVDHVESLQNLSPPFDHLRTLHGNIGSFAQSFHGRR
jgi:hypothetical protein